MGSDPRTMGPFACCLTCYYTWPNDTCGFTAIEFLGPWLPTVILIIVGIRISFFTALMHRHVTKKSCDNWEFPENWRLRSMITWWPYPKTVTVLICLIINRLCSTRFAPAKLQKQKLSYYYIAVRPKRAERAIRIVSHRLVGANKCFRYNHLCVQSVYSMHQNTIDCGYDNFVHPQIHATTCTHTSIYVGMFCLRSDNQKTWYASKMLREWFQPVNQSITHPISCFANGEKVPHQPRISTWNDVSKAERATP